MRNTSHVVGASMGAALVLAGLVAACASPGAAPDLDNAAEIARGGRLYDKWFAESRAAEPSARHELYPADGEYASKPGTTWRCKECHGWDYLGKDGAYASGKHATGIPGIRGMAGADPAEIARIVGEAPHGYGALLSEADLRAVALFVSRGQLDMDRKIDRASKRARGDARRGAAHFATLCAGCHGPEGKAEDMPTLGPIARDNPWETLHKILNGQPNSAMPALQTLDRGVAMDILAFTQTLPGDE